MVLSGRAAKKGLMSGTLIYLVSNVLNAAIPFALLPVLTRVLDPSEYGQVAMFQTLLAALVAVVGLNTVGAANRRFYDDDLDTAALAAYNGACLLILLASTILVALVFGLAREWLSEWLGISPGWVLLAVGVAAAHYVVRLRLGQWQVRQLPVHFGAFQISLSALNIGLSLVLVVGLSYGAAGRVAGMSLAPVVMAVLALALLARRRLISVTWRSEDIRGALRFGVPLIPHVGGAFLLTMADRLVINRELGLESAGIYMVAVQLAMGLSIALEAVNKAYVPWLYERLKRDDPVQKRNIVLGSYAYFGLLLGLAALSFVLGPLVLELLAGERYARAGDVIGWLVLGQAFRGMYLTVTAYIFYRRKTERLSLITIASGGVNLLLLLFMVKRFGLEGAAVSFAISALLLFLFTWWLAARTSPMPWRLTREA